MKTQKDQKPVPFEKRVADYPVILKTLLLEDLENMLFKEEQIINSLNMSDKEEYYKTEGKIELLKDLIYIAKVGYNR